MRRIGGILGIVFALVSTTLAPAGAEVPELEPALAPQAVAPSSVVDLGDSPADVVFSLSGHRAYVSLPTLGQIAVLDTSDWSTITSVDVGGSPRGLDLVEDGSVVLAAIRGTGEVIEFSTTTHLVTNRLDLTVQLDDNRTWDVREINTNDILVTATPNSTGFAYVVRYDRTNPAGAVRVASSKIVRAAPVIHAVRGAAVVAIGAGFSPNSLYILDVTNPAAPIVAEDIHGTVGGTRVAALDPVRGRVHISSGQIVSTVSGSVLGVGWAGIPRLAADGSSLWSYTDNLLRTIDPDRMSVVRSFTPSCPGLVAPSVVNDAVLDRTETSLVLLTDSGLCLEPLDGVSPPSAPTSVNATVGDGQANVSWSPPESDGGTPIAGYTATTTRGSHSCTTTTTSCVISGLANGTSYWVGVQASNAVGVGPASSPFVSVTPFGVPSPPSGVTASPGGGQVTLRWIPPTATGGSPVTGYTATTSPGGWSCSTTALFCTISGLADWTSYTVTVTATNANGESAASTPSSAFTLGHVPSAPSGLVVNADGTLNWSPGDNGSPIDRQLIEYRELEVQGGLLAPSPPDGSLSPLIVGGSRVDLSNHRYGAKMVGSGYGIGFVFDMECGAVFIASEWALTAAHCTEVLVNGRYVQPQFIELGRGENVLPAIVTDEAVTSPPPSIYVKTVSRHPGFDRSSLANDIALLRLRNPLPLDFLDTIPLFELEGPIDGTPAFVTGWGAESTNGPTADLLKGALVAVDESCGVWPTLSPEWDDQQYLCASGFPEGFCSGDSGGPLVVESNGVVLLAGLVSFSSNAGCAVDPALPDVYTRVSTHVDWIESITGPLWSSLAVDEGASSAVLAGLEPGKSYAVQVHAENVIGAGPSVVGSVAIRPFPMVLGAREIGVDCSQPQPHPLTDVPASSFAFGAVGCIYNLGITTGTSSTTYSPSDEVTREQMAAFLARFYETVTGTDCIGAHPFTDVRATSFAAGAIGCIYSLGITTGTSMTTYSPGDSVTREQMAAFVARLYRMLTEKNCSLAPQFVDVSPTSFAYLDIGCINSLRITTGTSWSTYSPRDNVTREQMAAFIARLYNTVTS